MIENAELLAWLEKAGTAAQRKPDTPIVGLMRAIAPVIADAIDKRVAPLNARIKELESRPAVKYCGIWREDGEYSAGNFVTDKGALWIAKTATVHRPGSNSDWQLTVKRGDAR